MSPECPVEGRVSADGLRQRADEKEWITMKGWDFKLKTPKYGVFLTT